MYKNKKMEATNPKLENQRFKIPQSYRRRLESKKNANYNLPKQKMSQEDAEVASHSRNEVEI